ncbi:MAG: hypothetical protein H8E58_00365 [SAR92 clade bacterium]|nr:hypothetical protein [SAR92 clade bacterium]
MLLDVTSVYVSDDLYSDGMLNKEHLDSVGKMGGDGYYVSAKYVEIDRP